VRVVRLPEGKDPDEVLRDEPDRWREEVRTAQPIVDYLIETQARQVDLKTAGGKARFVDAIIPTIRAVPNPVMRDAYLQRLRQVSGVEERVLLEVLHSRPRAAAHEGRITVDAVLGSADALPVTEILRAVTPVEQELLRLLLILPEVQLRVVDSLGADRLPSTIARELYRAILDQRAPDDHGVHPAFDRERLLAGLDDETAALARALYAKDGPNPRDLTEHRVEYELENLVLELEDDRLRERSEFNQAAQAEAERAGDRETIERLLDERRRIHEERRSLDRRREQARLLSRPAMTRA
jgi:DNA primase